jgi:hypothetical protein
MAYNCSMIVALLLLSTVAPGPRSVPVDMIELNHFYGEDGRRVLSQWIFWEYSVRLKQFVVMDWVIHKPGMPRPTRINKTWRLPLCNKDMGLAVIQSSVYNVTHTQYDPEIKNRELWPPDKRNSCWPERIRTGRQEGGPL